MTYRGAGFTQHFMPLSQHSQYINWTDVAASVGGSAALVRSLKRPQKRSLVESSLLLNEQSGSFERVDGASLLRLTDDELIVDLLVFDLFFQPSKICILFFSYIYVFRCSILSLVFLRLDWFILKRQILFKQILSPDYRHWNSCLLDASVGSLNPCEFNNGGCQEICSFDKTTNDFQCQCSGPNSVLVNERYCFRMLTFFINFL